MENYQDIAKRIIGRIRQKPDWANSHKTARFGDIIVGYYDTIDKGDFFALKYKDVEFTLTDASGPCKIHFEKQWDPNFDLMNWLLELDGITCPPVEIITLNGVKYQRIEEEQSK